MISVTAKYIIQPEKRHEFMQAIDLYIKSSDEQAGININLVGEVIGKPNIFFNYVEYSDEEAFSTHEQTAVMELMEVLGMYLADTPEAHRLDISKKYTIMSNSE